MILSNKDTAAHRQLRGSRRSEGVLLVLFRKRIRGFSDLLRFYGRKSKGNVYGRAGASGKCDKKLNNLRYLKISPFFSGHVLCCSLSSRCLLRIHCVFTLKSFILHLVVLIRRLLGVCL